MKKITIEIGDAKHGYMVNIVSDDFGILYGDVGTHHGLQCNHEGGTIEHKLIMSFCKRIVESANEMIKLNNSNP